MAKEQIDNCVDQIYLLEQVCLCVYLPVFVCDVCVPAHGTCSNSSNLKHGYSRAMERYLKHAFS
jgi:hypothetical protein